MVTVIRFACGQPSFRGILLQSLRRPAWNVPTRNREFGSDVVTLKFRRKLFFQFRRQALVSSSGFAHLLPGVRVSYCLSLGQDFPGACSPACDKQLRISIGHRDTSRIKWGRAARKGANARCCVEFEHSCHAGAIPRQQQEVAGPNSHKITSSSCQTPVGELVRRRIEFGPEINPMKPIVTAATLVAGFAVATTSAMAQHDTASGAARGVIDGIILGGKVGPDFYGFVPANIESRVAASGFAPTRSLGGTAQKRQGQPSIRYAVPRRPPGNRG
jgi:hypothetical protein